MSRQETDLLHPSLKNIISILVRQTSFSWSCCYEWFQKWIVGGMKDKDPNKIKAWPSDWLPFEPQIIEVILEMRAYVLGKPWKKPVAIADPSLAVTERPAPAVNRDVPLDYNLQKLDEYLLDHGRHNEMLVPHVKRARASLQVLRKDLEQLRLCVIPAALYRARVTRTAVAVRAQAASEETGILFDLQDDV